MDQELIAYLNERFNAIDQRFDAVDQRFDAADKRMNGLQGEIRGNGVEIEGLRGQIQQVAEGVAATHQRIDAFQVQVNEKFDEMGKLFQTSHSNLHRRVSALEARPERRRT